MARTWPVTRRKRFLLAAFDSVAGPVASIALRSTPAPSNIERILVVELWHMGDVVLATSALRRLRRIYPSARITLLAKQHAIELLEGSDLVDEVITFDFPWTATSGKYRPGRYNRQALTLLVNRLRKERFDLSIDCRMDLRSNILTRAIQAKRRVGYDFGGGGFLLTDAVPPGLPDRHKVDDWMALVDVLGDDDKCASEVVPEPLLSVSAAERGEAANVIRSYDIDDNELLVGLHPGGSHEAKRWSVDNFAEVGRRLVSQHGVRLIVFVDPDGCGAEMQLGGDTIFVRTTIREMMALLTHCDLLISNDSGPMHVAAALGVPIVAIFRTGSPEAYGPRGVNHTVVGRGAPPGMTSEVALDEVADAADAQVRRLSSKPRRSRSTA